MTEIDTNLNQDDEAVVTISSSQPSSSSGMLEASAAVENLNNCEKTGEMGEPVAQESVQSQNEAVHSSNSSSTSSNMIVNGVGDDFIRKQLQHNLKDRAFMLGIENELITFLNANGRDKYNLKPCNAYFRRLEHHIADYFNLGHQVDQHRESVVVFKTAQTKMPEVGFRDLIKSFESQQLSPSSSSSSSSSSEQAAESTAEETVNREQQKKQILKREINARSDVNSQNNQTNGNRNGTVVKTYEEKTADYLMAKNRIFNTDSCKEDALTNNNKNNNNKFIILNRNSKTTLVSSKTGFQATTNNSNSGINNNNNNMKQSYQFANNTSQLGPNTRRPAQLTENSPNNKDKPNTATVYQFQVNPEQILSSPSYAHQYNYQKPIPNTYIHQAHLHGHLAAPPPMQPIMMPLTAAPSYPLINPNCSASQQPLSVLNHQNQNQYKMPNNSAKTTALTATTNSFQPPAQSVSSSNSTRVQSNSDNTYKNNINNQLTTDQFSQSFAPSSLNQAQHQYYFMQNNSQQQFYQQPSLPQPSLHSGYMYQAQLPNGGNEQQKIDYYNSSSSNQQFMMHQTQQLQQTGNAPIHFYAVQPQQPPPSTAASNLNFLHAGNQFPAVASNSVQMFSHRLPSQQRTGLVNSKIQPYNNHGGNKPMPRSVSNYANNSATSNEFYASSGVAPAGSSSSSSSSSTFNHLLSTALMQVPSSPMMAATNGQNFTGNLVMNRKTGSNLQLSNLYSSGVSAARNNSNLYPSVNFYQPQPSAVVKPQVSGNNYSRNQANYANRYNNKNNKKNNNNNNNDNKQTMFTASSFSNNNNSPRFYNGLFVANSPHQQSSNTYRKPATSNYNNCNKNNARQFGGRADTAVAGCTSQGMENEISTSSNQHQLAASTFGPLATAVDLA